MIDFANIKSLYIPEGEVVKIMRGSELLWEKMTKKYQKELAYIESTGTQWINTDHVPNNRTSIEMVVSGITANSFTTASGTWFVGARTGYLNKAYGFYYNPQQQQFYYAFGNVMPSNKYDSSALYNVQKTIKLDSSGLYVDGTKVVSQSAQNFSAPVPLSLFGLNNNGGTISLTSFKLYSFKIWQDGALVRDFIPVLDMDNVACLYDKISEQKFYNLGTGEFNYSTIEDEYREVGYIESTGTEWINTGYAINTATDSVYLEFEALDTTIYKWLFGEHDNNARFGIGTGDGTDKRNVAYGNNTYKVKDTQIYNGKHIFQADSTGVYLDGTKIANYSSFQSTSSLYLFNLNLSGGSYQTKARVWKYQHYRNGELIRDMFPCLSKSLNRAGLFDRVSMKFFGNNGTGEFQYSGLPIEYEQVEFIESTGTQFIDTGLKLTSEYSVELDYQITNASQKRAGIFGSVGTNTNGRYGSLLSPSNSQLEHGYGATNTYYQTGIPDLNRHLLKQEKNKLYVDGELIYTFPTSTFSATSNAYLCNFNFTNYNPAKARYFGAKFWDGDELIRNFIPCYRKADGVAGLYDTVTKAFFTNKGTGNFVYPTDIEVAQLMRTNSLDEDMIEALSGVPTVFNSEYDDNVVE